MPLDGRERGRGVAFNGDERNEGGGEGLFSSSFVDLCVC